MNVQMEITFPDGQDETQLEQLNALLSSVEWSKVRLKEFNGGSVTTLHFSQNTNEQPSKSYGYAFEHVMLECSREEGEPVSRYQIETEYLPQEQVVSSDRYREKWLKAHPERQMVQMSQIAFEDERAFVVLSREKTEDKITECPSEKTTERPPKKMWILDEQFAASYQKNRESCFLGNFAGEPIEWLVMEKKGDACLLVSKYALTLGGYDSVFQCHTNWEKCALRQWLNTDFYNKAFSSQEQQQILLSTVSAENSPLFRGEGGNAVTDKIFLLSISEAKQYFVDNNDRICLPGKGVDTGRMIFSNGCYWWLRSMGCSDGNPSMVTGEGIVYSPGSYIGNNQYAVRPAMWVRL